MPQGMTLAEILKRKVLDQVQAPLEVGAYGDRNPLGVRVGGSVAIDTLDLAGLFFTVREIRPVTERVGESEFTFTDYGIVAAPASAHPLADSSGRVRLRLRIVPVEESDAVLKHDCLLLTMFYEAGYRQAVEDGLLDAVQDKGGLFNDTETGDQFQRRFGDLEPHLASVTSIVDRDGDGRVVEGEVKREGNLRYWDYEQIGGDAFLFAEQDRDGYFRLYRGKRLPQEAVTRL